MTSELATFDYAQIDTTTADFLRTKERNMREIVGKAYTELGRELKEAQEALANNRNGVFQAWIESVGFRKDKAYDLIRRYDLIVGISDDKRELLEDLPVSLTYEIAAPSAESTEPKRQAKAAVLEGDITTLKEYREMVKRLEEAEERATQAEQEYEAALGTIEALRERPPVTPPPPQIKVVADPEISDRLKRYEAKYGDIDGDVVERISNVTEVNGAAAHFADDTQSFLLSYAHLTTFRAAFAGLSDDAYDEYRTSLEALKDFVNGMQRVMDATPKGKSEVIDITDYQYRAN